jgi:hypothetical protein
MYVFAYWSSSEGWCYGLGLFSVVSTAVSFQPKDTRKFRFIFRCTCSCFLNLLEFIHRSAFTHQVHISLCGHIQPWRWFKFEWNNWCRVSHQHISQRAKLNSYWVCFVNWPARCLTTEFTTAWRYLAFVGTAAYYLYDFIAASHVVVELRWITLHLSTIRNVDHMLQPCYFVTELHRDTSEYMDMVTSRCLC